MLSFLVFGLLASVLANGVVELPVKTVKNDKKVYGSQLLDRRAGTPGARLVNSNFRYLVEIKVGTPGQRVRIDLDTGSSDLWVMSPNNPHCSKFGHGPDSIDCHFPITFDPRNSSTFHNLTDKEFQVKYASQKSANGTYFQDTLNVAGIDIANATMGLGYVADSNSAIFGLGYPNNEGPVRYGLTNTSYPNVPQVMKQQGYINSVVYSLWLNDPKANVGSILFGGIDHAKYEGELTLLPIVDVYNTGQPKALHVRLDGISASGGSTYTDCNIVDLHHPVLLDSGSSAIYLPSGTAASIANTIGYTYSNDKQQYVGNCTLPPGYPTHLNFHFGGNSVNISIPVTDFVLMASSDDANLCALAVSDSTSVYATILGDIFLRYTYTVFDLDNNQIAIAPAKFRVTDSDIETAYSTIPAATSATVYESSYATTYTTIPYSYCPSYYYPNVTTSAN